ncbi:serpentine type 7TM GPCR receptor class ab chemoreceptor domain-containing protein [Ditylenchus destructor]|uniref:Serpentine type 7TM GPCR receptor class ab chemoreceptor domain-containing protein n=1 Tax=Ditylenchus destructor TaxID=166010 RepID=A0AAD4QZE2_9BILA|nr:serpentine type 7TM GPCR receptor class ab chemoreceptor domain-containing protein [Ditylenchus destructor]
MEVTSHNWTETCDAGGPLESNVTLRFCHFCEIILNLGSLFLIFTHVPWKRIKERKLPPIHINFTILLANGLLLYFIHTISVVASGTISEISHLLYSECAYTIITWKCLTVRTPSFVGVVGFSFLHLFLFAERCLATVYLKQYATHSAKFGILITLVIWPVIILWNIYIVYDDDPIAYKPYCLQTSPMNAAKMSQMLMILLIVDIVTTVGDISLRIVNRIQRKRKNVDYSLPKSYQIAENASATKVIVTLSLVHSLTFTSYLVLTNVVRICLAKADLGTYISAIEGVHLLIRTIFALPNFDSIASGRHPGILSSFQVLARSISVTVIGRQRQFCVIHENVDPITGKFPRYWGYVVIASKSAAKRPYLHHSASHFLSDGDVCNQAATLFERTQSRSLVVASVATPPPPAYFESRLRQAKI